MTTATVQRLFPEAATGEAVLEIALMRSRSGRRARVSVPSGERDAAIAAGCVISPAPGDRVLVARAGEETFILSVLEQSRPGEARMVFDQGVSLNVLKGKLRVLAQEGVDLMTPEQLNVHAASVGAEAGRIQVGFSLLDLVGQTIASKSKKVRVVAETFDTIAGRIYQRAVNFLRRTDELDRVEAKNIDLRAEQLLHVHGENAVTTAEHLVKIDGSQVHVG
jgi:hypothetical protein